MDFFLNKTEIYERRDNFFPCTHKRCLERVDLISCAFLRCSFLQTFFYLSHHCNIDININLLQMGTCFKVSNNYFLIIIFYSLKKWYLKFQSNLKLLIFLFWCSALFFLFNWWANIFVIFTSNISAWIYYKTN